MTSSIAAALVFVLMMLACGGSEASPPVSPWSSPPDCDELYVRDFVAIGGDPDGEWLPVRLCHTSSGTMTQIAGECPVDVINVRDYMEHVTLLTIQDGTCQVLGTGLTMTDKTFFPLECLSPYDPVQSCLDIAGREPTFPPGYDVEVGDYLCSAETGSDMCICSQTFEFGPRNIYPGDFPCSHEGTRMSAGENSFIEMEFSVEGDFLVRRGVPREGAPTRRNEIFFEVYRRR